MKRILLTVAASVCALGGLQCGKEASPTLSPTSSEPIAATAYPDGSPLKVVAPVPQSPVGGQRLEQSDVVPLVARNAARKFGADVAITYRFQVFNAAGAMVAEAANIPEGAGGTTTY